MSKLGISLYPDVSKDMEKDAAYLKTAAKHGFSRLFVCLLNCEDTSKREAIDRFTYLNALAKDNGYEIIFDVAPATFDMLGISYDDLSLFKKMHADGIRLDEGFNGAKEAMLTYNPYGLKIEINASSSDHMIDQIMSYHPNTENLLTCHNYYPMRYSGLGSEHLQIMSQKMKAYHLRTAAFITSQSDDTFGPWPVNEGLCTLEEHRFLPIDLQLRHFKAMGCIDDILIGNAYASEKELMDCQKANTSYLSFRLELNEISGIEDEIIFDFSHVVRGDKSEYMARSTMPRIAYKDQKLPPHDTNPLIHRGDVIIINETLPRYKGELHICLKDMENDGRWNVAGTILKKEFMLLDYLKPWQKFAFIR